MDTLSFLGSILISVFLGFLVGAAIRKIIKAVRDGKNTGKKESNTIKKDFLGR